MAADPSAYARMSDAELRAMEKDSTLPVNVWQSVVEEIRRRDQAGARPGAPAAHAPYGAHAPPPQPPPRTSAPAPSLDAPDDTRVEQALREIAGLLVPGEQLLAWAVQRRLFALVTRRQFVAATTGRLVVVRRGLFGGFTPVDVRWQDLGDAALDVGIFGATLRATILAEPEHTNVARIAGQVIVPGLRKEQAGRVYRVAQGQEQAWREKRRVRDLDEMRARAGGVQIGAVPGMGGGAPADGDPRQRLQRAREMRDQGLITDAEYETIKARIVGTL